MTKVRKKCNFPGCSNNAQTTGLCQKHHMLKHSKGECSIDGCKKHSAVKGFCMYHYRKSSKKVCKIEGCKGVHVSKGLCSKHYKKLLKYGDPLKVVREQHRMRWTPEYRTWLGMKGRCYFECHPSYKWYGAKGIKLCKEWENSFMTFFKDMGHRPSDKHSIDRIDSNKDYSKENCKWSLIEEQNWNQNTSINNKSGFRGVQVKKSGFYVEITAYKKITKIGTFKTFKEAKQARIMAEIKYWRKQYSK